jgi:hypothetical protein
VTTLVESEKYSYKVVSNPQEMETHSILDSWTLLLWKTTKVDLKESKSMTGLLMVEMETISILELLLIQQTTKADQRL